MFDADGTGVQASIKSFGGASGWTSSNNDFVSLTGWSKGSSFAWDHDDAHNPNIGFYRIHDAALDQDFMIQITTATGHHVGAGDFNFY